MSPAPPQGTRKGYPYHTTKRPTRPMHGRGGVCPHPGESGANPRQGLKLMGMGRDESGPYAPRAIAALGLLSSPIPNVSGRETPVVGGVNSYLPAVTHHGFHLF